MVELAALEHLILQNVRGSPCHSARIQNVATQPFAEQVGPGNTTIALTPDGSIFGQSLESSLKGWGYAIVTDQQAKGTATVPLAYVVDAFEGSVLVRLSTAGVDITRMYKLGATGAEPISPVSIMQRGSGASS